MSKLKAPFYSFKSSEKTPVIHYQVFVGNFYLGNKKSHADSEHILELASIILRLDSHQKINYRLFFAKQVFSKQIF